MGALRESQGILRQGLMVLMLSGSMISAGAQSGDRGETSMPEVWREMNVPPAPVLSPEEALRSFTLVPGYRIELVASEPLTEDPVALKIDGDGRLWVVEMRGYMPDVDGKGEDIRNGRVSVLEDTDGDGRMDRSTVFLDELQMPRAVGLVAGGVLVAEPPFLWYCRDTDGDLKCDQREKVLSDYGRQGPVEHTDNGLMPAIDNWIYNAKSSKRLRFVAGQWVVEENLARGQWGIDQDSYGRLYYNHNASPIHADLVHGRYMTRNRNFDSKPGVNLPASRSAEVWTGRVNPGINRGYQKPMLRDGRLARFTAASGLMIYRGGAYPDSVREDAFIPEPGGNMIRHQTIEHSPGRVTGVNAYDRKEWLTSTDERFRPVSLYNAPDGTVYIVDFYRGILQHRAYVTSFLRKQILERGLDKPVGLGRIYRVVHESKPPGPAPRMSRETSLQLVAHLEHPSGWWRDTAQRLLVERGDREAVPALREMIRSGATEHSRIHALWTLEGLGRLDPATIEAALGDESRQVALAALRVSESLLNQEEEDEEIRMERAVLIDPILALAQSGDPDLVRQVALTLSTLRLPAVEPLQREMARVQGADEVVRAGIIHGLQGRELEFLGRLLSDPGWAVDSRPAQQFIEALIGCVIREGNPARVERALTLVGAEPEELAWRRDLMLRAMAEEGAGPGRGRKPTPLFLKEQPVAWARLEATGSPFVREQLARLTGYIKWGADAIPPLPPRELSAEEARLFTLGKEVYELTCASCHLATGLGEEGKAPPILDSPFVLKSPEVLIRIVLNGITGPVEVHGRTYDMSMPAVQGLTDAQVAGVLTYVRREWDHGADPIGIDAVQRARAVIGPRELPWTAEELGALR